MDKPLRDGFDSSLYVARPALEADVVAECRRWYHSNARTGWLSLRTVSARGNTWLLHALDKELSGELVFEYMARTLVVSSSAVEGLRNALSPLQDAFTRSLVTRTQRAKRLLGTALKPGIILLAMFVAMLALLSTSAGNYFPEKEDATLSSFFFDYVPRNAHIYIAIMVVAAIASAGGRLLMRLYLQGDEDAVSAADRMQVLTTRGMIEGLRRHARGRSVLLVLIDRSHLLTSADRTFLYDCLTAAAEPEIRDALGPKRILFITIDEVEGLLFKARPFAELNVTAFSDAQLLEIARRQRPDLFERLKIDDPDARSTFEEAKSNLHALVTDSTLLESTAGDSFLEARRRNPAPASFGADSLMVYEAVRVVAGIGSSTPRKEHLGKWLAGTRVAQHLAMFGIARPAIQSVLEEFRERSAISRFVDEHVAYDTTRCRSMVAWARKHAPDVAARAYCFWLMETVGAIGDAELQKAFRGAPPLRRRGEIRKGAWLALELTEFCESPDVLFALFKSPESAADVRRLVVSTLCLSLLVDLREGESAVALTTAEECVLWIDEGLAKSDVALIDSLTTIVWEMFWLTADSAVRDVLTALAAKVPAVTKGRVWGIESRFLELVSGAGPQPWKPGRKQLRPLLADRAGLAEAFRATRAERGYLFAPGEKRTVKIGEPSAREFPDVTATAFRALAAAAALEQESDHGAARLDAWTAAARTDVAASCVGDEVVVAYGQASLAHARYRLALKRDERSEAEEIAKQSATAYERCLLLGSMLGWRGLTAEVSFHFGELLLSLWNPDEAPGPEDWETWETAFQSAIDLETAAQWTLYTPDIQMVRWTLFRNLSIESALELGYNAYVAARQAGFPRQVIARVQSEVHTDFVNGGNTSLDYSRSAELQEEWVELAEWPEARRHWTRKTLAFERVDALAFAAQSYRKLNELEKATETLDRAQAYYDAEPPSADAEIQGDARAVRLRMRFQRMALHGAKGEPAEEKAIAHAIWAELTLVDDLFPSILREILADENPAAGWPVVDGAPAEDAEAPQLSIPAQVFPRMGLVSLNVYEYRLLQLALHAEYHPDNINVVRVVLHVGELGLMHSSLGRGALAPVLVKMLETSLEVAQVRHQKLQEVSALELLFMATDDPRYRELFIAAAAENEELIQHELELASHTPLGWYALAERLHHLLHILVDKRLTGERAVRAFAQAGADPDAVIAERQWRTEQYALADTEFAARSFGPCILRLDAALPPINTPWVFWDDLCALNQWIGCTQYVARDAPDRTARSQQLRAFTTRYVQQLASTIQDEAGHLLALRLQRVVEEALRNSTRLPIAAEHDRGGGGEPVFDPERLREAVERIR